MPGHRFAVTRAAYEAMVSTGLFDLPPDDIRLVEDGISIKLDQGAYATLMGARGDGEDVSDVILRAARLYREIGAWTVCPPDGGEREGEPNTYRRSGLVDRLRE